MKTVPDLCDEYPAIVRVVDPIFRSFGGRKAFGGEIATVKCFEDNSCVKQMLQQQGNNRVLVVDGGGSMRRACLGDRLAALAAVNSWSGIVVYGCVRDLEELALINLGVMAIGIHPMKTEKRGIGDIQIPVTFSGVTFVPGKYLYADSNGIVVASSLIE